MTTKRIPVEPTTEPIPVEPKTYRVTNPRGIPTGRYILRLDERQWFEGDTYDGPVTDRLIEQGFIVEVSDG